MINGSFVFGMDDDDEDVFRRTVDWAIAHGITTATFHIQTPYPGTRLFARTEAAGADPHARLGSLRHAPRRLPAGAADPGGAQDRLRLGLSRVLSVGIDRARVARARLAQASGQALLLRRRLEEVRAAVGSGHPRQAARVMTPLLEAVLSKVTANRVERVSEAGALGRHGRSKTHTLSWSRPPPRSCSAARSRRPPSCSSYRKEMVISPFGTLDSPRGHQRVAVPAQAGHDPASSVGRVTTSRPSDSSSNFDSNGLPSSTMVMLSREPRLVVLDPQNTTLRGGRHDRGSAWRRDTFSVHSPEKSGFGGSVTRCMLAFHPVPGYLEKGGQSPSNADAGDIRCCVATANLDQTISSQVVDSVGPSGVALPVGQNVDDWRQALIRRL